MHMKHSLTCFTILISMELTLTGTSQATSLTFACLCPATPRGSGQPTCYKAHAPFSLFFNSCPISSVGLFFAPRLLPLITLADQSCPHGVRSSREDQTQAWGQANALDPWLCCFPSADLGVRLSPSEQRQPYL